MDDRSVRHGLSPCLLLRSVKNVLIHNDFAQLVARLKDTSPDGYLLSGLTKNKYGDRSNAIGKRFGRMKKRLSYGPRHVFHSWRNTIASQIQTAGVPESHTAPLIGHEIQTMTCGGVQQRCRVQCRKACFGQAVLSVKAASAPNGKRSKWKDSKKLVYGLATIQNALTANRPLPQT